MLCLHVENIYLSKLYIYSEAYSESLNIYLCLNILNVLNIINILKV